MVTVNTESLGKTLDAVNDALFYRRSLTERNRKELAELDSTEARQTRFIRRHVRANG